MENLTRTFDILPYVLENYPQKIAIAGKKDGKWKGYSSSEFYEMVQFMSSGLLEIGCQPETKIASITTNIPEWNFLDMGMTQLGIIHVPIYPNISEKEYDFILNHCEAEIVFVSDETHYKRIKQIVDKSKKIKEIYAVRNKINGVKNFSDIIELGKTHYTKNKLTIEQLKNQIKPDDLLTIIYTSGTTGTPKGVMLTHWNVMSNVVTTFPIQPLNHNHTEISFLPLCHVYERMLNYMSMLKGISIYYIENLSAIADSLQEVKPDGFHTVPRLLEMFYDKIVAKGKDLEGIKKKIFFWAIDLGFNYSFKRARGPLYQLKLGIANQLVYRKIRESLGGNLKIVISGGSSLQTRLQKLFWTAHVKVIEGYGLTETSPVISVNHANPPDFMFGTVGPVINGVEVKIADDGEILIKGQNVMKGYYKDEKATSEVFDDDKWFHTGDIGTLVDRKFLKITDRKKEIFKLSSGKYIAPQVIENRLKASSLIDQVMILGENKKFASSLISPNFNYLHFWASKHKIHYRDNQDLIQKPEVIKKFQREISEINKQLALHENIKRLKLVPDTWTPQTGELSPTLKLKRKVIFNRYKPLIQEIFATEHFDSQHNFGNEDAY